MPSCPTARAVASTYTVRTHEPPFDIVAEYDRVKRVASAHPNKGSSALSSIVELPRSRIRVWVDGNGKPDVARGLETARAHGWLDVDMNSSTFAALNTLVAAVFSGGTINDRFEPAFSPDEDGIVITRVDDALSQLGVGTKTRHHDDPERSAEIMPGTDASVLGRILVALGAPHGGKNDDADLCLPRYLDEAPETVRENFVQIYLWNRAQRPSEGETTQIIENRSESFKTELGALVEDVANAPVYVSPHSIRISADATRELRFTKDSVP